MTALLDTSLVLDLLDANDRSERFGQLILGVAHEWCTSPLVRMESRIRVLAENDAGGLSRVEAILGATISLPLTERVFETATEIRARTGLKPMDALHVATALEHGCAEIWTADARLSKATAPGLAVRVVT